MITDLLWLVAGMLLGCLATVGVLRLRSRIDEGGGRHGDESHAPPASQPPTNQRVEGPPSPTAKVVRRAPAAGASAERPAAPRAEAPSSPTPAVPRWRDRGSAELAGLSLHRADPPPVAVGPTASDDGDAPADGGTPGLALIGPGATDPALRARSAADLSLRRSGDHWLLTLFDAGTARAQLGRLPLGPGSPAITSLASELRLVDDGFEEVLDLSSYATDQQALRGRCRLLRRHVGALPGTLAWHDHNGLVSVVRLHSDGSPERAEAVHRDRVQTVLACYPSTWAGAAEEYCKALRLDLLDALGWWPLTPEGCAVDVAACGPGPNGPVSSSTAPDLGFAPGREGPVLSDRGEVLTVVLVGSADEDSHHQGELDP